MVSLFGWKLVRDGASSRSGYKFNDTDRFHSQEVRRLNNEIKRLQKERELRDLEARLEEEKERLEEQLQDDDEQEEEEDVNPDAQVMTIWLPIIKSIFSGNKQESQTLVDNPDLRGLPVEAVNKVHYTDEEIATLMEQIPKKAIKIAKGMDDVSLRKHITAYQPHLDEDSIQRAIAALRAS